VADLDFPVKIISGSAILAFAQFLRFVRVFFNESNECFKNLDFGIVIGGKFAGGG